MGIHLGGEGRVRGKMISMPTTPLDNWIKGKIALRETGRPEYLGTCRKGVIGNEIFVGCLPLIIFDIYLD
jgi:hypothetical protein